MVSISSTLFVAYKPEMKLERKKMASTLIYKWGNYSSGKLRFSSN